MNGQRDDMQDEIHDESLSHIYRQSRIEEPPMALDSAILSQARKAVEKRKLRWSLAGWLLPLGSVAVVMLAATLFIQMRHEHPEVMTPELAAPAERQRDDAVKAKRAAEPLPARDAERLVPAAKPASPAAAGTLHAPKARSLLKEESRAVESFDAAPAGRAATKPATGSDPKRWLDRIRELIRQGKTAEARASLAEFGKAYPDVPVPQDIATALK